MQGERQSRHLYDIYKMMNTPAGYAALSDTAFYTTLLDHRKNYIRLSGIDYDSLHYATLSFIPAGDFVDMFRRDYEAMQTAMIHGPSPGFDEMLDELKLLNGRFRLMGKDKQLEEIIAGALQNEKGLVAASIEGSIIDIPVHYVSNLYQPAGPYNESITYMVQFIRRKNKLVFQKISIHK